MNQENNITLNEINRLAFPAILSGIAEPMIALVDTAMIGQLGTVSLGAVGLGSSLFLLTVWILTQTKTAISAVVSKHYGARTLHEINTLIPQAFLFNISLGFVILGLMYVYASDLLQLYAAKGNILKQAVQYFRIRSLGFPVVLATYGIFGVFRGLQNTSWAMQISLVGGAVNLVLDYLLIFGVGPFPALGIEGAALASLSAQVVMLILAILYFLKKTPFNLRLKKKLNDNFQQLVSLSSGFFIRTIALNVAFFMSNRFATSYGEEHIAAHTIAINIWLFSSYFIDGYANAGNAISGRLFGQKQFNTLYDVGMRILKISLRIGSLLGCIYLALYEIIPNFFSNDPEVISLFKSIFWLIIISQPINAMAFAFDGIFKGLGRSYYLMITLLVATFIGFVPVLLLADYFGLQLYGIWVAFMIFMLIRSLTLYFKFKIDFKSNA